MSFWLLFCEPALFLLKPQLPKYGSVDYAIVFSTAPQLRIHTSQNPPPRHLDLLTNDAISPLFLAVIEAIEEAIYNSMFRATTIF